jgi:hypothetical protein
MIPIFLLRISTNGSEQLELHANCRQILLKRHKDQKPGLCGGNFWAICDDAQGPFGAGSPMAGTIDYRSGAKQYKLTRWGQKTYK